MYKSEADDIFIVRAQRIISALKDRCPYYAELKISLLGPLVQQVTVNRLKELQRRRWKDY